MYVLDRETGEVLSASPFVPVTTSSGIDSRTGRPRVSPAKEPRIGQAVRDLCPGAAGGKNWQPSSFSPRTGLLYIPHNNLCEEEEIVEANYIEGTPYIGANVKMYPDEGTGRGGVTGWDPVAARLARLRGAPVYCSFDIDAVDPAFAPGTGTPEVGGLTSYEAQALVRALAGLELVGADVVEVSPPYDGPGQVTALLAANLLFELVCLLALAR